MGLPWSACYRTHGEAILKIVRFSISPPEYDEQFEDIVEYEPCPRMGTMLPLLVDAGMLQLITGKKYEPAAVAGIIVQRQIADADIIEELLESSHGALLQGSL